MLNMSRGGNDPLSPPSREGPLEFFEEKQRVRWFESNAVTFESRWVVLKDCTLAIYEDEDVALFNDKTESMLSIQLSGCLCQRHPTFERTLVLENSAMSTLLGTHRKILLRAEGEGEIATWMQMINESSLWDVALRAAASLPASKRTKKKKRVSKSSTSASCNYTWETNSDTNTVSETPCTPEAKKLDDLNVSDFNQRANLSSDRAASSQTHSEIHRSTKADDVEDKSESSRNVAGPVATAVSSSPIIASCAPTASSFAAAKETPEAKGKESGSQRTRKEVVVPNLMAWQLPLTVAAGNGSNDDAGSFKPKQISNEQIDENPMPAQAPAAASFKEQAAPKGSKASLCSTSAVKDDEDGVAGNAELSAHVEEEEADEDESSSRSSDCRSSESESEDDSDGRSQPSTASSDFDTSDEERNERARAEFMRQAYHERGSDSEDDLADLDQKLQPRDDFEARLKRVRRVRRFYRRRRTVFVNPVSWGTGFNLCLGHGSHCNEKYPRAIKSLKEKGVMQVAVGAQHCAALCSSGQIYSWGIGLNGRLGQGNIQDCSTPKMLASTKKKCTAVQVACGAAHSAYLTQNGKLFCWGRGLNGELGSGERHDQWTPSLLLALRDLVVSYVACGTNTTFACTGGGLLFSWGSGKHGCLGLGDREDRLEPALVKLAEDDRIIRVACGEYHCLALTEDGKLWGWGRGAGGCHGLGHTSEVLTPHKLPMPEDRTIVSMSCGRWHSAYLTIRGDMFCFGSGRGFSLGNGREDDCLTPTRVNCLRKFVLVQISCGGTRTAALARGGNVYMWGGGSVISDPEKFQETFRVWDKVQVQEDGGVLEPPKPKSLTERLKKTVQEEDGVERVGQGPCDPYPPALLRAALAAQVQPDKLLTLRYKLVLNVRELVALFDLHLALLDSLPPVHPSWKPAESRPGHSETAGGVGGGESGSQQIIELQTLITSVQDMNVAVGNAMAVEVATARKVWQLCFDKICQGYRPNKVTRPQRKEEEARVEEVQPEIVQWLKPNVDVSGMLDEIQLSLFGKDMKHKAGEKGLPSVLPPQSLTCRAGGPCVSRGLVEQPYGPHDDVLMPEEGGDGGSMAAGDMFEAVEAQEQETAQEQQQEPSRLLTSAERQKMILTKPKLLRLLKEKVSFVCVGDGVTIAGTNETEALGGVIASCEMRLDNEIRHEARVADRKFLALACKDRQRSMQEQLRDGKMQRKLQGAKTRNVKLQRKDGGEAGEGEGEEGEQRLEAAGIGTVEEAAGEEEATSLGSREGKEEGKDKSRQGWLLVHEVRVGLQLPNVWLNNLLDGGRKWDTMWAVLSGNELLLFTGPTEALPASKVVLDGYFVLDTSSASHWNGPPGTDEVAKDDDDVGIPTLELRPSGFFYRGPDACRHLYCRAKDKEELGLWLESLQQAAVLNMVHNTVVPFEAKRWDVDVDWTVPDVRDAWKEWEEVGGVDGEEKRKQEVEGGSKYPAMIGAQMKQLSDNLDRVSTQLSILKEHHRNTLEEHRQRETEWTCEKVELKKQLAEKEEENRMQHIEIAKLKVEIQRLTQRGTV